MSGCRRPDGRPAAAALLGLALLLPVTGGCRGPDANHRTGHHSHHVHDFSDAERWARVFDDPGRDRWQRPNEVISIGAIGRGMVVADIGAGTGYFVPHLCAAVGPRGRVIATDIEPELIEHMQRRFAAAGLSTAEAKMTPPGDPLLPEGGVDRILIVNTWHHIAERIAYGAKLLRALRPGGQVIIVDYTLESPQGPPKEHRLPASWIEEELRDAGFSTHVPLESLPHQFIVIGVRPEA
jgi:ubiquinone/menaquinone biosynthesis C-methylase UbiE